MSVTLEDRLHYSKCFNEPIQPEDAEGIMELLEEKDDEITSLNQSNSDEEEVRSEREESLTNAIKEQHNFLTQVRDWLNNPTCKRVKIAEECTKWLREHP